ncbi:MAG: hypothetical protein ACLQJR_07910, partial [Stellaceae bacterium]
VIGMPLALAGYTASVAVLSRLGVKFPCRVGKRIHRGERQLARLAPRRLRRPDRGIGAQRLGDQRIERRALKARLPIEGDVVPRQKVLGFAAIDRCRTLTSGSGFGGRRRPQEIRHDRATA